MSAVEEEPANPFAVSRAEPTSRGMVEVAASRQAQEVQAAMVIAKKFPRDEIAAYDRIMKACKRRDLASHAVYVYPRGDATVEGPSIRLAEVLAQQWGNIDFGVIELEQGYQESTVMAYAWDLETNTRQTKIFHVPHKRHTRTGSYALKDPRDIYEMVANNGARRLRACILGVIPGDIVDAAVKACGKTLENDDGKMPIEERRRQTVVLFSDMGVTKDMLETRLGHKIDTATIHEIINLGKIYKAITDNMASIDDYFSRSEIDGKTQTLKEKMASKLKNGKAAKDDTPAAGVSPDAAAPSDSDTESPEDFKKALAKLSLHFDERGNEIDELLKMNGVDMSLLDISKDCADERIMREVVKIAAEF